MKAERYLPNYFSGFKPERNQFDNSKELFGIDWISDFKETDGFHRFSIGRDAEYVEHNKQPQHVLMAEYKDGYEWWVVAFIRDKDISGIDDIPNWKPKNKPTKK